MNVLSLTTKAPKSKKQHPSRTSMTRRMGFEALERRELLAGGSALRVVLDPGHGGGNVGTTGLESGVAEKDLTLDMANRVKNYLASLGVASQLTRTSDADVDYGVRAKTARSFDADFFLSLHFNGFARGSGLRGTEALVMASNVNLPEDRVFADTLIQWTCSTFQKPNNRGVKVTDSATGVMSDGWFGNTANDHPVVSALLEVESISSNLDVDRFFNNADATLRASNRNRVAQNIARGIVEAGRNLPTVAAPGPLQLKAVSSSRVDLTWTKVTEDHGYRVFIWQGGQPVQLATVGRDVTSYSATGLSAGQTYWFRVEAFNGTNSGSTAWNSITVPAPAVVVPDPLRLNVTSNSSVGVSWNNVANEDGYRVFLWRGGQQVLLGTVGRDTTSFSATGLTPGQTYWFRVEAFNATSSATTAWASIGVPALSVVAPEPLRLSSASGTQMDLAWTNVANEDGYRIYTWNGSQAVLLATVGRDVSTYRVTGLAPGRSYWFFVQAYNAASVASTQWTLGTTRT